MHVAARRGGEGAVQNKTDEELLEPKKQLDQCFGLETKSLLNIITSFNPDIIEQDIVTYL
jgi:hypothetical protein